MSRFATMLRAYAELGRISNLPTCATNVLVGCAIGAAARPLHALTVVLAALAVVSFYLAGMALNDVVDLDYDKRERPERPIPSGRISRSAAIAFVLAALAAGLAIAALLGTAPLGFGLLLAVCIVVYDWLHKRFAAAALLMGACRGLVYLVAASAVAWPIDVMPAAAFVGTVTLYTMLLTVMAQRETEPSAHPAHRLSLIMPFAVLPAAAALPDPPWLAASLAGLMVLVWMLRSASYARAAPPRMIHAVLGWLSGFCLIDAFFLTLLRQPVLAMAALVAFFLTVWSHRRIVGT